MEMLYERNAQYERQFYSHVNYATLALLYYYLVL